MKPEPLTLPQQRAFARFRRGAAVRLAAGRYRLPDGHVLDPAMIWQLRSRGLLLAYLARTRLALSARGAKLMPLVPRFCRRCGCTDNRACAGGCSWVARDLCSACAP